MFDNRQREEEKKEAQRAKQREAQREEKKVEAKNLELSILYESKNEQDSWLDKSHQANANPGQSNDTPSNRIGSGS